MGKAVVTIKRGRPHFAKTPHKGPTQAGEIIQLMEIDSGKALKSAQIRSESCERRLIIRSLWNGVLLSTLAHGVK